ncbi:hypothetical protein DTL72_28005 [Escherichia coli]|nr:hypothetical protein DTL38_26925 [Escherichia coli]RCY36735.1 hypothetical protein DTL77_27030 [Escherichia coli]RCY46367.1 hypothetical protein DTL72_28005 [Escherichia coli]RCY51705.1 hypothetical protein DTL40_28000 [Escherichia coli]RCY56751.1 hypothetical protein DTL74_27960 [Escherichia coli]
MLWESSYPEIFLIPALSFSYLYGCQYIIIFTSNMDNFNLGLLLLLHLPFTFTLSLFTLVIVSTPSPSIIITVTHMMFG